MRLFLFSTIIFSLSFCSSKPEGYFLTSSSSHTHEYEIIIHHEGAIFFGPEPIIIYYRKNNSTRLRKLLSIEIANDGKSLNPGYNCEITWKENKAFIYLRGEEQEEKIIQIDFESGKPIIN